MRVLVTGATGYVGSRLVATLVKDRADIVVGSRNLARLTRFGWFDEVTPTYLDAADAESVSSALVTAGPVDVIYYLVHGIGQPGYREADNAAARNVALAARDAGVRRIVYLGGFVPEVDDLSEHLAGRAEVAAALSVDAGPEVVWLGAAMILGAGSTSFEMLRYVGDRFPVIPMPPWARNPMDPISIRDVLHYLVAAADGERVPPGGYDIHGPDTTTYGDLLLTYARLSGRRRHGLSVPTVDPAVLGALTAVALPVPGGLASDLVASLDHPMRASGVGLTDLVPDPPGGLIGIEDAVSLSLSGGRPRPVDGLADPHHLADTDPGWAGGDALRIRRLASRVTPAIIRPALGLLDVVPGPVAGAVRASLDTLLLLAPKGI